MLLQITARFERFRHSADCLPVVRDDGFGPRLASIKPILHGGEQSRTECVVGGITGKMERTQTAKAEFRLDLHGYFRGSGEIGIGVNAGTCSHILGTKENL